MQEKESELSIKNLFEPLTTLKASNIIILVGFIVFFNILYNGFLWDDFGYIINNQLIHQFNVIEDFGKNTFNDPAYYYRPISAIYFTLIYSFAGNFPFFYHLLQLVLHITNAILIYVLFGKFLKRTLSLLLSLIFLIHPLNVESVSFIAATVGPLSFFFGMIAFLIYTKDNLSKKNYLDGSLLLLFSLFSKESGILFMLVILLYKFLFNRKNINRLFIFELGIFILYFIIRIFSIGTSSSIHPNAPILQLDYFERLINIPKIIFYYIKTFFYPMELYINQHWLVKNMSIPDFYLPLGAIFAFFFILYFFGRYIKQHAQKFYNPFVFFFCWFILGIILLLPLFPLDMTVADRWFYFPMVGLLGLLGICLQNLEKNHQTEQIIITAMAIILVLLSVRTMIRNANYYNEITLFAHDSQTEDNYEIEMNLGTDLLLNGDMQGAFTHIQKSVDIHPYEANLYDLGNIYERINNIQKAKEYYTRALNYPNYSHTDHKHVVLTYQRLGQILVTTDTQENSTKFLKMALEDYPNDGILWALVAIEEYKLNHQEKALAAAEKAKTFLPNQYTYDVYTQILNKNLTDLPRF